MMELIKNVTSSRAFDLTNRLVHLVGRQFGYFKEKIYHNDPSLIKRLKDKREFRVAKLSAKRSALLDQIRMHYDDNTEWSHGPECGDDDPRVLVMTDGEYLIRVTHETLIDQESAGGAVEFETNKGRIVKFVPYEEDSISLGRDEDKKTVIADAGYEIISLIIDRGELKGTEQQPVPEEELQLDRPQSWYVIAYYAEKEDSDLENELLLEGTAPSLPPGKKDDKVNDQTGDETVATGEDVSDETHGNYMTTDTNIPNVADSDDVVLTGDRLLAHQSTTTSLRQRKHKSVSFTTKESESICDSNINIPTGIDQRKGGATIVFTQLDQNDKTSSDADNIDIDIDPGNKNDDSEQTEEDCGDSGDSGYVDDQIEDNDIDYYFFFDQHKAKKAWFQIKELTHQKQGRGAILIDCLKSTVLKKSGSHKSVDHCRDSAVQRGLCLPVNEDTFDVFELASTLYHGVAVKTELIMFLVSIFVTTLDLTVGTHRHLLEAQILTAIATDTNTTDWRTRNVMEQFLCDIFLHCDDSYLSICQSLLLYYFAVRISLILFNMVVDCTNTLLAGTKLAAMSRDMFIHTLSLDMRFFEETRNIHDYMNVTALHRIFQILPLPDNLHL